VAVVVLLEQQVMVAEVVVDKTLTAITELVELMDLEAVAVLVDQVILTLVTQEVTEG
jgi:hypothetical protein